MEFMSEYDIITIRDGIYHIRHKAEPFHVYSTLITGETGALLLDTGPGIYDLRRQLRLITELPLTVVNSHGHMDHCGGNRFFHGAYMTETDIELRRKTAVVKRTKVINKAESLPADFDTEAYINAPLEDYIPVSYTHLRRRRWTLYSVHAR